MGIKTGLPEGTTEDVIDMVAKVLLIRSDASETLITWAELERAAGMKCEVVKGSGGVTLRWVKQCVRRAIEQGG